MKNEENTTISESLRGVRFPENLSRREYFAAKAMQGMCANSGIVFGEHRCPEHPADCARSIAESSVLLADALIQALNEKQS